MANGDDSQNIQELPPGLLEQLQAGLSAGPQVVDPAGGSTVNAPAAPNAQQILSQYLTSQAMPEQQASPNTGQLQQPAQQAPPQQQQRQPRIGGMPLIARYLTGVFRGQRLQQQPDGSWAQGPSRGDMTMDFLSEFLGNMAQGLSQAGTGPGANARGFGAAVQAPYQRAMQDYQVQQQAQIHQGQLAQQQADIAYKTPSIDMEDPDGNPIKIAPSQLGQALGAQYKFAGTKETAQAKRDVAQTNLEAGIAKTAIAQGQPLPVDKTIANLVGMPELADKPVGKGTWDNIKKALDSKGYKLADLGSEGAWIIDRGGNRIKKVGESPSVARGMGYALGRAMYTPFETVEPGTNIPTTISNLQALKTGAPKVSITQQAQLGGRYALFNDAYGILDKVDNLADKINLDDPEVSARIAAGYAALKDPATSGATREILSNVLLRQPINRQLSSNEREMVLLLAQGKAAGTGLRSIMGQAGTNQMQQSLDSALMPGPQGAANKASLKQQVDATRQLLNRFTVGQPQVGLNAPGSPTALPGAKQGGGTVNYRVGNKIYRNIPKSEEKEFLNDKKGAVRIQ
jgi:hypothetical protein